MPFRHHVSGRMGRPLGLNPAGVLPFRNHARQSLLRTNWPPLVGLKTCLAFSGFESIYLSISIALLYLGFAVLLAVSKMPFRHHVSGRFGRPLGLNPAGVLPFRNHARQSLLRTTWPPLGLENLLCFWRFRIYAYIYLLLCFTLVLLCF